MWKTKKKLKSDFDHIKQGPAYHKSPEQLNTIKILKLFMNQEKNSPTI